jgi:hypothetical protein
MPGCHQAGGFPDRSRQPGLPFRWFSRRMHDAIDSHRATRDFIEHSVWKPAASQPASLLVIPAETGGDIGRCFRCEAYLNRHGAGSAVGPSSHPMIELIAAVPRGFRDAVRSLRVARGGRAHRPADSRHRPRGG